MAGKVASSPFTSEVSIVFPHQLFAQHPAVQQGRTVILIEEWLFFTQYNFHKIKLAYHRATMKAYQEKLERENYTCHYIEATHPLHDIRNLPHHLKKYKVSTIHVAWLHDDWLEQRLHDACKSAGIIVKTYDSPMFLGTANEYKEFFDKQKKYFQTDFYIWQRKRLQVLLLKDNQPVGGKWTYDTDNRKKISKGEKIPALNFTSPSMHNTNAWKYVETHYNNNPGDLLSQLYPTNHDEAKQWLQNFLNKRFYAFGDFEDAMQTGEHFLFHSVLTPMLNTGLLTPDEVLDTALAHAEKHNIAINNSEGFIRQILGWREFIMAMYSLEGRKQRSTNFWGFTKKIPSAFYNGTTGVVPVDDAIKKLLKTGYNHHIERLMILGNFFLLCEFDPDAVYQWFMEMYIDAYDWVMVPNVYGMTQFADGGLMTTKPYISSSNYIMKMSNYPKGDWQAVWDGLFWRFMYRHQKFFGSNPRLGMLLTTLRNMDADKRKKHLDTAEKYLQSIH